MCMRHCLGSNKRSWFIQAKPYGRLYAGIRDIEAGDEGVRAMQDVQV